MATNAAPDVRVEERSVSARAELSNILESDYFRNSQRCSGLLRYSVEHVLNGCKAEDLKERVIGFELFHRGTNYDPAQDNVVRTAASDLRKRLAQYYNRFGSDKNPIFELPSGSYAVICHWREGDRPTLSTLGVDAEETELDHASASTSSLAFQPEVAEIDSKLQVQETSTYKRIFSRKMVLFIASLFSLLIAGLVFRAATSSSDGLDQVWAPILRSGNPVFICIAEPTAWLPSRDSSTAPKGSFIQVRDTFVGVGDAYALAQIGTFLTKRSINWRLLAANNVPPQDLRSGPAVLIGSFSDQWSLKWTGEVRFKFDSSSDLAIVDQSNPNRRWELPQYAEGWKTTDDYALVSGFLSTETGQPTIALAGITNYGTQGAADFVTDSELLKKAFRLAPHDWHGGNFQFVLHVKVLGNTPTVVASHFW